MKKFKTLRNVIVGASLLMAAGPLRPAFAWFNSTYLETSVIVNVSSQTASPSTIIAATTGSSTVEVWCHQLNNAGEQVLLKSSNTGFSVSTTTGTARINCAANNAEAERLRLDDYIGPLYGVTSSTYTVPVQVIRKK